MADVTTGAEGEFRYVDVGREQHELLPCTPSWVAEIAASLLVLDEPWEGLDPDASRWLTQSIRARRDAGAAVLVSSHRLHELAEVCDRCAFLVDGDITLVDDLSRSAALTGAALLKAFDALRP